MTFIYEFGDSFYEYEPDYEDLDVALIELMCYDAKSMYGADYDEVGAKQMASFLVKYAFGVQDYLLDSYKEELKTYFEPYARRNCGE